jgi:hypothetical protein
MAITWTPIMRSKIRYDAEKIDNNDCNVDDQSGGRFISKNPPKIAYI